MRSLFALLIAAMFSLGCMGAINGLTGLDMHMEFGNDAKHPDVLVVQELSDEKVMAMGMTASGDQVNLPEEVNLELSADDNVRMELITYKVDATQLDARQASVVAELEGSGYAKQQEDGDVVIFNKGASIFAVVADKSDESTLTLMQIDPVLAGDGDAPAEE